MHPLRLSHRLLATLLAALFLSSFPAWAADPPAPAADWSRVDAAVRRSIEAGEIPGAVVLIGHDGKVVYRKAFGNRSLRPRQKMTTDTVFDLASLTKVVATTPSIMQLLEQGRFRLNDPVAKYLPGFAQNGKEEITIRQLLTHFSGLPPDIPQKPAWSGYQTGVAKALAISPAFPPGSHFEYSDINFVVLAELVHKLTGQRIDRYALEHVWKPLGMDHTRYLPPANWLSKIAPTGVDGRGRSLRGVVNDPTAASMDGVTGDAGAFSTADDLAKYAQALLNGGVGGNGHRILAPQSVVKMSTPQSPPNIPDVRGLGWDLDTPFSSNRGGFLPLGSYGHTGFTGTSLWIDPSSNTYVIILANDTYPDRRPTLKSILALRSEVATVTAAIVAPSDPDLFQRLETGLERITGYNDPLSGSRRVIYRNGQVLTGLDVARARGFRLLEGKNVGLVTNPTGLDRDGHRNLDDMIAAGVHVAAAFSPEHGWSGSLDGPTGNARDSATSVPVFSAYTSTDPKRALPAAGLDGINVLVYDIQDVGARWYTFETTLAYTLKSAAARHIPVIVYDRPNPIDGIHVEGPPLAPEEVSFVGYFPGMPVRNGMTVGELASLFNKSIGAELTVVRMQGWSRGDFFDETGLTWTNPSPNMRSLTEAVLYPGVAMIEATNVSVGRGTDTPFELMGAPWVKAPELAAFLNARRIPGVRFVPVNFTPTESRYAHQVCHGVNLIVTNRERLISPELGVELASALAHLYPQQWDSSAMPQLAGSKALVEAIRSGEDPRRIADGWADSLKAFEAERQSVLLYR
ncbi:MAG: serine hydrolase [Terriglobales bacterium]